MKYGYSIRNPSSHTYSEIRDLALRIEKLGYNSIHITDHLLGFDETQEKKEPYLEVMTLLGALAVETKNIRLGQIVLCNSFRNPAYLAKMILTLDHISNGRALIWLGAGWYEEEYKAYGYPFPSPKRRVDEFEESLTIYKKIFTENETNFDGNFWKLERHRNFPKSIQKPYPQLVVGSNGKRMIDIACREADGINFASLHPWQKKIMRENISLVYENLKKYNRDRTDFELSLFTRVTIVDSQDTCERIRKERKLLKSEMKYVFLGTPESIKEKITDVENLGVDKMVIFIESPDLEDPIDVFNGEIF
ncbi:MAG: LLM class flavin-dependent oxidoreductase [Promethearchaeota archaeon]|jgi:alkanesulfonate monooxygenase SsuD/methylene tetrahydromethanopterin reductase-like flavin-dependent oxidoreductase (luciferase family)